MTTTRTCHICGTRVAEQEFCPTCLAAHEHRRNAEEMTGDERAAELAQLDILEIPFHLVHQRIEELVGRPVFAHEMAGYDRWQILIDEARTRQHPSMDEIIDKVPADKPAIVVDPRDALRAEAAHVPVAELPAWLRERGVTFEEEETS